MGAPSGSFLLTSKSKLKFKTVSLEMVEEEQTHVKRSGMFGRAWSNDGDEYSEKHAFSVTSGDTVLHILCKSATSRDQWIGMISRLIYQERI